MSESMKEILLRIHIRRWKLQDWLLKANVTVLCSFVVQDSEWQLAQTSEITVMYPAFLKVVKAYVNIESRAFELLPLTTAFLWRDPYLATTRRCCAWENEWSVSNWQDDLQRNGLVMFLTPRYVPYPLANDKQH